MIKLGSVNLSDLQDVSFILTISFANSVDLIDEAGAPENFYIRINTALNSAIRINEDDSLSLLEQYTDASSAGIYESYIEFKSFEGLYSISSNDENSDWSLDFHGNSLEDEYGEISEEQVEKIMEFLNPKSIFKIASEVLSACK